jgi:hypothetical protein
LFTDDMEAGYSPLELLALQCPLLLRDLVAPRLKLRELGALRQSCSVLRVSWGAGGGR